MREKPMTLITYLRCFNHARREASAFCTECRRAFCRECITEHEGRVVCTPCLAFLTGDHKRESGRLGLLLECSVCILSSFVLWALFYHLGTALQRIPTQLHETFAW